MADVTVKRFDEVPIYTGPGKIPGIEFHMAGRELGVKAWGMNVLAIEAGCTGYPEHDHANDGQEEVYVVLRGSGTLEAEGTSTPLAEGVLARVGPTTKRKILPGPGGIVVLALGGVPGQPYPAK